MQLDSSCQAESFRGRRGKLAVVASQCGWFGISLRFVAFSAFTVLAYTRAQSSAGSRQQAAKQAGLASAEPVNLDVLVTDEDELVLAGLKREHFLVLDQGKPQTITNFESVGAQITMVMLMEYSGSTYSYFAYKTASWASNFLEHLESRDYVALVTYDIKPTVRTDFTRNKAVVRETLRTLSLPKSREANLYDALIDTLDRLDRVKDIRLRKQNAAQRNHNNSDITTSWEERRKEEK